jgi:hypothetical protein
MPRGGSPGRFIRFLRRVVRGIVHRIAPVHDDNPFGEFPTGVEAGNLNNLPLGLPPMRLVLLIVDDNENFNFVENLDDEYFQELLNQLHNAFEPQGVPPASEKIIDNLNDVIVESTDTTGKCTICLEKWHQGETITKLNCQHSFCKGCIVQWLKMHNTCPLCRESIKEDSTTATVENGLHM